MNTKLVKKGIFALFLGVSLSVSAQKKSEKTIDFQPKIENIKTHDGISLHLKKDLIKNPKAVLVISHGLASHSGVFDALSKTMNENAIAVYRFDHRGHGKSDGRDKIHIKNYFEMVEDLDIIVQKAKNENPNTPIFVLGHSMGGHIAALYGTKYPNRVSGFVLAAGVLRYHQMNFGYLPRPEPADAFIEGMVAHFTLNLPFSNNGADLSLPNDPLILQKFSVSFPNSFVEGIKYLKENSYQFKDAVLLVSGDADLYVVPQDAIDFYGQTNSVDKSLRLYSRFGHLLMLEKGGEIITNDITQWIKQRMK